MYQVPNSALRSQYERVMPGGRRLEAAMVVLHKVGGGADVNLDHPHKYSVTVSVSVTVVPYTSFLSI